jgi:hypothetical protein
VCVEEGRSRGEGACDVLSLLFSESRILPTLLFVKQKNTISHDVCRGVRSLSKGHQNPTAPKPDLLDHPYCQGRGNRAGGRVGDELLPHRRGQRRHRHHRRLRRRRRQRKSSSTTAPPPFRRNRHGRTHTPHTESLVGLFSLPLDNETTWGSTRHPPPPPTLRSSLNCHFSFVPLPRKSAAQCDDDDWEGDGDAFDSIFGRRTIGRPADQRFFALRRT